MAEHEQLPEGEQPDFKQFLLSGPTFDTVEIDRPVEFARVVILDEGA